MADVTTVVDAIATIEDAVPRELAARARLAAGKRLAAFRFAGGSVGLLDVSTSPGSVWASVLRNLHELAQPAYVEIDPATNLITQVLQPKLQPVGAIEPAESGGGMRVELMSSHAQHFLRRSHPRYAAVLELLQDAQRNGLQVWVTETLNTHEIIDVRPAQTPHR